MNFRPILFYLFLALTLEACQQADNPLHFNDYSTMSIELQDDLCFDEETGPMTTKWPTFSFRDDGKLYIDVDSYRAFGDSIFDYRFTKKKLIIKNHHHKVKHKYKYKMMSNTNDKDFLTLEINSKYIKELRIKSK